MVENPDPQVMNRRRAHPGHAVEAQVGPPAAENHGHWNAGDDPGQRPRIDTAVQGFHGRQQRIPEQRRQLPERLNQISGPFGGEDGFQDQLHRQQQ